MNEEEKVMRQKGWLPYEETDERKYKAHTPRPSDPEIFPQNDEDNMLDVRGILTGQYKQKVRTATTPPPISRRDLGTISKEECERFDNTVSDGNIPWHRQWKYRIPIILGILGICVTIFCAWYFK